jgi:hypothetical protein
VLVGGRQSRPDSAALQSFRQPSGAPLYGARRRSQRETSSARARAEGACSPPRTNACMDACMERRAAAGPFQQLGKQLLYVLRSAMKYSTRRQNKALGLIMYSEQQAIYYALRPPTVACRRWKDSSPHLSRPAQKSDKNKASERPPYRCKQTRSRSPSTEFG